MAIGEKRCVTNRWKAHAWVVVFEKISHVDGKDIQSGNAVPELSSSWPLETTGDGRLLNVAHVRL